MDMMEHFIRPKGAPPTNGYSHAVAFHGPMGGHRRSRAPQLTLLSAA